MSDGVRIITIPRNNPVTLLPWGGIARDAGLTVDGFKKLFEKAPAPSLGRWESLAMTRRVPTRLVRHHKVVEAQSPGLLYSATLGKAASEFRNPNGVVAKLDTYLHTSTDLADRLRIGA